MPKSNKNILDCSKMAVIMIRKNIPNPITGYPDAYIELVIQTNRVIFNLYLNPNSIIADALLVVESLEGVYKNWFLWTKFTNSDYFQTTFNSNYRNLKLGHKIHNFIIEHKDLEFNHLQNIYSTNNYIDSKRNENLKISDYAIKFWKNRVKLKKAKYCFLIGRYKIKW